MIIVETVSAVLLTFALLRAISGVGCEGLLERLETLQKVAWLERLPSGPRRIYHGQDVLGPEVAIRGVDLGDVTE